MGWYEEEMRRLDQMVEHSRREARRTETFLWVCFLGFVAFAVFMVCMVANR